MSRRGPRLATMALALAAAGCSAGDDFVPIGSLALTQAAAPTVRFLDVKNAIGSIRVLPSRSDEVAVHADVAVRSSLKSRFPAADPARDLELAVEGDAIWVRSRHLDQGDSDDWRLDLSIEAPARLHWTLMQAVGEVRAQPDGGDVVVNVATGKVELSGRAGRLEIVTAVGDVQAGLESTIGGSIRTSTGEIALRLGAPTLTDGLELETATGAISIELPHDASLDAELVATVGSVDVRGAPGVKTESALTGSRAIGTIGKGGPTLRASAGVGSVRLEVRE